MSNRPTEHTTSPRILRFAASMGAYWWALKDCNGHIRDWVPAPTIKYACQRFADTRPKGILPGYTIERGPKVKA
jgi:hypothetical protein